MKLKFFPLMIGGLAAILVVGACQPAQTQPTARPEEVEAQVSTSVALTITAYKETQAALATPTAMDTPTPTVTPTSFPTLIPFTAIPTHPLPNVVPSSLPYACAVVAKVPADSTIFKPNKDFDVKFWIRNVGTEPWAHGADLLYDGGTNMLTTNARYELPAVKPGQQVGPFIFDAQSPRKAGTFTMTFKVQGGFCYPYVRIIVRP